MKTSAQTTIERFSLNSSHADVTLGVHPGLRISIRSTSSSIPNYAETDLSEVMSTALDLLITDGTCS